MHLFLLAVKTAFFISLKLPIPVEIINGLLFFAAAAIKGKCVSSKEAILKQGTLSLLKKFKDEMSNGELKNKIFSFSAFFFRTSCHSQGREPF